MNWHVYALLPIDTGWDFALTVAEAIAFAEQAQASAGCEAGLSRDDWRALFNSAQAAAEEAGWQGDFRQEPHVLMLPLPTEGRLTPGFIWKQGQQGTCFVVSPLPLPWLEANAAHAPTDDAGPLH